MGSAAKTTLQGWKEIADYLHHDVRTVKRWEKQRQLPVRRMPGEGRSNVYVRIAELEDWLNRPAQPAAAQPHVAESPVVAPAEAVPQPQPPASRRSWPLTTALATLLVGAAATVFAAHAHRIRPVAPTPTTRYLSPVSGVDDLYLRGVYFYEQHTPGSLAESRRCLQQAVARDPADAPAWSALAGTTLMLEQFESLPQAQGFDEAGTAASRALALDPSLADAHASLAFIDFVWSHDAVSAEREFRTALALDPNSATAHHRYGVMLLDLRRFPEALAQLDLALRLQPDSTSIVADRALALGFNGHRDDAVEILQSVAAQQPQNPIVYRSLTALAQLPPRNIALFLVSLSRLQEIEHQSPPWSAPAARAYRSGGEHAMWQAIVASEPENSTSVIKVEALTQLGQAGAALDSLERAAQSPGDGLQGIALDPLLDPLHGDPRFQYLLARNGLTPVP